MSLFLLRGVNPLNSFGAVSPLLAASNAGLSVGQDPALDAFVFQNQATLDAISGIQYRSTLDANIDRVETIRAWTEAHGGTRPISRVLIANRGDPAIRSIRAVREFNELNGLDIRVAVVHCKADAKDDFVQLADEAIELDLGTSSSSYENIDIIIEAAKEINADAIYPGWGFISEHAAYARAVEEADMVFVGPTAEHMELMGHKHSGLTAAGEFNLPVGKYSDILVPPDADLNDTAVIDQIIEQAVAIAVNDFGLGEKTVMLKDSHGGGGKGNRRLKTVNDLRSELRSFIEAGNTEVFFEEFAGGLGIEVQHIEFQVIGDGQGEAVVVGWRQCSCQREDQKVFEMTHTHVPLEFMEEIQEKIRTFMKAKKWQGPGTFEFLVSKDMNKEDPAEQYSAKFMEMNTRLQVEHGISEESYEVDIFNEMLRVTMGMPLSLKQEDLLQKHVTLEARILAEMLGSNGKFVGQKGDIDVFVIPGGPGIRFDSAVSNGSQIRGDFDSMIAKLMVSAPIPYGLKAPEDGPERTRLRDLKEELSLALEAGTEGQSEQQDGEAEECEVDEEAITDLRAAIEEAERRVSYADRKAAMDAAYELACARLVRTLAELDIAPLQTNVPALLAYVKTPEFKAGAFSLGSFEAFAKNHQPQTTELDTALATAVIKSYLHQLKGFRDKLLRPNELLRSEELPPNEGSQFNIIWEGKQATVRIAEVGLNQVEVYINGTPLKYTFHHVNDNLYSLKREGESYRVVLDFKDVIPDEEDAEPYTSYKIKVGDNRYSFAVSQGEISYDRSAIVSPVDGEMWVNHVRRSDDGPTNRPEFDVPLGSWVKKGTRLGTAAMMKGEIQIEAQHDGIVTELNEDFADLIYKKGVVKGVSAETFLYRVIPCAEDEAEAISARLAQADQGDEEEVSETGITLDINLHTSSLQRFRAHPEIDDQDLLEAIRRSPYEYFPVILNDLKNYFLGYDYNHQYIGKIVDILMAVASEDRRQLFGFETELADLIALYLDIGRLRDPEHAELYTRFIKGVGQGRFLVADGSFEGDLVRVLNYYGMGIDPETVKWHQVAQGSQLFANALMRFRLAERDLGQRRQVFAHVLGAIGEAELRGANLGKAIEDVVTLESDIFADATVREAAEAALEKVDISRYTLLRRPTVPPKYEAELAAMRMAPKATLTTDVLEKVADHLEGRGSEDDFSRLPQQVREFVDTYQDARKVNLERIFSPFDHSFAFRILRPNGAEQQVEAPYLVVGMNRLEATMERGERNAIIGSPRIESIGRTAAHALHVLQEIDAKTNNEIYLIQNDQYEVPFDDTGSDDSKFSHASVKRIGENIFEFFHGLSIDHTSVILPLSVDDERENRVFTFQVLSTGLHAKPETLEAHFSEVDPGTRMMHERDKLTAEERAEAVFGKGNYEEITYPGIDDVLYEDTPKNRARKRVGVPKVGVKLYKGNINGLPVMIYAGDFRREGGAFGKLVGSKLARAQFEAYMQGLPLFGLMDGAGANIEEGLVSLNYSAEDFMFKVITLGVGRTDMFQRWLVHHPDRPVIESLLQDYGPGGSQDGVMLRSDRRFQDLAARMNSPSLSGVLQVGAGIGMVVYGSSLTPIQTIVDLPEIYRLLTGSRVRLVAKNQKSSDYDVGGAQVHARRSGEVMAMFGTEQECYRHFRKILALFHPQARRPLDKIQRIEAGDSSGEEAATDVVSPAVLGSGVVTEEMLSGLGDTGTFLPYKKDLRLGEGVAAGFMNVAGLPVAVVSPATEAGFGTYESVFKAREVGLAAEMLQVPVVRVVHGEYVDSYTTEDPRAITTRRDMWENMAGLSVPQFTIVTDHAGVNSDAAQIASFRKFYVKTGELSDEELFRIQRMNFEIVDSIDEAMDRIAETLPFLEARSSEEIEARLVSDPVDRPTQKTVETLPEVMEEGYDVREIIRDVADNGEFREIWADMNHPTKGPSLVVGLANVGGKARLVIADQPKILSGTPDYLGARKYRKAVEYAEKFGLPILVLNDAPGFDPSKEQEAANIQGEGAESIEWNIKSTVPVVVLNLRKGYGGRWIHSFHPFLRPGIVSYIVKGAEVAVMGAGGAVAVFNFKEMTIGGGDRDILDVVAEKRAAGYGNPQVAVDTGAAEAIIGKNQLREFAIKGFAKAEAEAELAFNKPYNTMTAEDLNISAALQRLEVLGFDVRAVATPERTVLSLNIDGTQHHINIEDILPLLWAYPSANRAQLEHLLTNISESDSVLDVARARQTVANLMAALRIRHQIEADQLIIEGAQYYMGGDELIRYAVPAGALPDVQDLFSTSGLEMQVVMPEVSQERARTYSFSAVGSTNDVAKKIAREGAASGSIVIAAEQTNGRGQMQRAWHSPAGKNLYSSSINRGEFRGQDILKVQFSAAVAVAGYLRDEYALEAEIKWPNDVYVDGRKIGGVLVEFSENEGSIMKVAVVGIGLNVHMEAADWPPALQETATSLRMQGVEDEADMTALARAVQRRVEAILQESASTVEEGYNQMAHFKQGSSVTVRRIEYDSGDLLVTDRFQAEVIGVDINTGQLRVSRHGTGEEVLLQHGRYRVSRSAQS